LAFLAVVGTDASIAGVALRVGADDPALRAPDRRRRLCFWVDVSDEPADAAGEPVAEVSIAISHQGGGAGGDVLPFQGRADVLAVAGVFGGDGAVAFERRAGERPAGLRSGGGSSREGSA